MVDHIERLRERTRREPASREAWLALGNALYGKDSLKEMAQALSAFRQAQKLGILAVEANHAQILGPDGRPIGAIQEPPLPDAEWKKCRLLMQRIRAIAGRGMEERAPGMHRPMDPDRRFYPRGVAAHDWDEMGTLKEREKLPLAHIPGEAEVPPPVQTPLNLPTVEGDTDEELSFDAHAG